MKRFVHRWVNRLPVYAVNNQKETNVLPITINEIVNRALNIIGEYSPNETPQQRYFVIGHRWANLILARWSASGITIPFYDTLTFNLTPTKNTYTISQNTNPAPDITGPRILSIIGSHIPFGNIDYPLNNLTDVQYYGGIRNDEFVTRPQNVLLSNDAIQTTLTFYPTPDQAYTYVMRFKGQFNYVMGQSQLNQMTDIYNELLVFELALVLSMEFPTALWDQKRQAHLDMLRGLVVDTNQVDMTISLSRVCSRPYGMYLFPYTGGYW